MDLCLFRTVYKRLTLICLLVFTFSAVMYSQRYVTNEVDSLVPSPDGGQYHYYMITAGDATLMIDTINGNVKAGSQADSTFTYFYYDGTRLIGAANFSHATGRQPITERVVYGTKAVSIFGGGLRTSPTTNLGPDATTWVTLVQSNNVLGFRNKPSVLGPSNNYLVYNGGWDVTSGLGDVVGNASGTTLKFYEVTDLVIDTEPEDAVPERTINFSHYKGQANPSLNKNGMQDVHELVFEAYLAPGETRELVMPVGSGSAPHAYFRWYNYDTDRASNAITANLTHSVEGYLRTDWGNIIANNVTTSAASIQGNTMFTYDGNPITIACDASNYADFPTLDRDETDNKITAITEPTLSYRTIYKIRSSSEIAARLSACTSTPLEEYDFVAPDDNVIMLTTAMMSYGNSSNYFYTATDRDAAPKIYKSTTSATSGYDAGSTPTVYSNRMYQLQSPPAGTTWYYELRANNGQYIIARWKVTGMAISNVGPSTSEINTTLNDEFTLSAEQNFDNLGGGDYSFEGGNISDLPLRWSECSYGFTYPSGSGSAGTNRVVNGGHYFTNWGEYAIVKTTPSNKSWLVSSVKSHTNPGTGSYMYVDANEAPGVVSNLIVDGNLCPGSEIIVSAWVVSHTTSGTKPNLNFILMGVNANGTEDRIQSYTTGKNTLTNAGTWYNILFRVTLGTKRYSQYRVKIENNNNSAAGNDFGIDDIKIYTSKSPLTAVEAITACDIKTQQELLDVEQGKGARTVILRVDFKADAFSADLSGNVNMKYAWIDDTEYKENFTTLPLNYFNPEPYSIAATVVGNVGKLSFRKNIAIADLRTANEPVYNSLADYFAKATVADGTYFFIEEEGKYLNEENQLVTRPEPVLYIVHKDTCFKRFHEYSCMLTTSNEFTSDCGGFFTTKIQNCKQLLIDGEPQETTNLRFKTLDGEKDYNLSVQVYYNDTDDKGKVKAATPFCDWVCGVDDRFIEASLTRSFVKFRQVYPTATSLDQPVTAVFTQEYKDSLMAYADKIQLYKRSVIANVPGDGTTVQYVAYAIAGSCDDHTIAVCPNPLRVRLRSDVRFSLGKRDYNSMPEDIQGAPAVIRIAESFVNEPDNEFTMMVNYVQGTPVVEGEMYLYRTTDPNAQEQLGIPTYTFTPNIAENNTHTYKRVGDLNMLPGHEYKFSARYEGTPHNTAYGCFIVKVVPDIVIFNPENENSNWHNDDFWKDNAGNSAFIPVSGTKVILPVGNTILEDYNVNSFEEVTGVTYHLNYNYGVAANTCGSIYFPVGAAMYGQKFLTYDNAYVDVPVTSDNYSLMGLPLQEVYSGDIFMPLAGDKKGNEFLFNPAKCDNRIKNRMFQKVYNSTTTYHYYIKGQNYDSVSTAIAGWGNPSHDLTKVYKNTAIAVQAQAGNIQNFIQLPKRDSVYYYYAISSKDGTEYQVPERYGKGEVNRSADYAKLLFDKNANPFTYTYENIVEDNWFLVVNPFMGNLSVSKLMSANTELTDGFYYDYTDGVMTAVPVEESTVIKPAGAFFVHTKDPATQLTLTFNSDMADATLVKKSAAPAVKGDRQMLTITATCGGYSSKATLEEDTYCHNDYNAREDADMLLFDAGLTPFGVYTRYNDKTLMVNAVNTINMIPMSVSFVDTVVDINIRFTGVDNFDNTLYLYDKLTDQYTEITEGMTIGWSGLESDADRYYINIDRSEIITSDEENYSNDDCIITVDGNKVTVISGANIKSVKAYDIAGKLIAVEPIITAADCTFTLPAGVYVVEVETENKVSNNKVIIK